MLNNEMLLGGLPKKEYVAVSLTNNTDIRIFSIESNTLTLASTYTARKSYCINRNRNANLLVSGSTDKYVQVFDVNKRNGSLSLNKEIAYSANGFTGGYCVAFSRTNDNYIAVGDSNGIFTFNYSNGTYVSKTAGNTSGSTFTYGLDFTRDDNIIISGSYGSDGMLSFTFNNSTGVIGSTYTAYNNDNYYYPTVSVSPTSNLVASVCQYYYYYYGIHSYTSSSFTYINQSYQGYDYYNSCDFHPSGNYVAYLLTGSTSYANIGYSNPGLYITNTTLGIVASNTTYKCGTYQGADGQKLVSWNANGDYLIVGYNPVNATSGNSTIRLFHFNTSSNTLTYKSEYSFGNTSVSLRNAIFLGNTTA